MADSLLQAYLPLLFWTGLGLISCRFLPDRFPRLLGRSLYWAGVPIEILALARQTPFNHVGLVPLITLVTLLGGLLLGWLTLQVVKRLSLQVEPLSVAADLPAGSEAAKPNYAADHPKDGQPDLPPLFALSIEPKPSAPWQVRSRQGSFLISSMLGNTGFVGLAVAPAFIQPDYLSWLVFYSVTQNVLGTYGIGVLLSSYFGRTAQTNRGWTLLRDVLTVPSLWAFSLGVSTRSIAIPATLETLLSGSVQVVIPAALILMGIRISQLQGWKSLKWAIAPALLKVLVMPLAVGIGTTIAGLAPEARLALVLMAGMPTAFAGLILAEEYELDRELIASSIVLTTVLLLLTIPLWLWLFS